jgi:hypothetical protein
MPLNPFSAITAKVFGGLALAFLAFAMVQTIRIEGVWCSDAEAGEKPACVVRGFKQELQITRINLAEAEAYGRAEAAKHKATKQAYRDAQEEAARMQAEIIAAEVARQERITDEVRADYQQRIAALRARADRLRREAEAAARGSGAAGASAGVRLPENGDPATGADAAPRCVGLSGTRDPLTQIECDRIATEQAVRLDALITWIQQQLGVID